MGKIGRGPVSRYVRSCEVRHGSIVLELPDISDWRRREEVILANLPCEVVFPIYLDALQVAMAYHWGNEPEEQTCRYLRYPNHFELRC